MLKRMCQLKIKNTNQLHFEVCDGIVEVLVPSYRSLTQCRQVQRSAPHAVSGLQVRASSDQHLHDLYMVLVGRSMQCSAPTPTAVLQEQCSYQELMQFSWLQELRSLASCSCSILSSSPSE